MGKNKNFTNSTEEVIEDGSVQESAEVETKPVEEETKPIEQPKVEKKPEPKKEKPEFKGTARL